MIDSICLTPKLLLLDLHAGVQIDLFYRIQQIFLYVGGSISSFNTISCYGNFVQVQDIGRGLVKQKFCSSHDLAQTTALRS